MKINKIYTTQTKQIFILNTMNEENSKKKTKIIFPILLITIILSGVIYSYKQYTYSQQYIDTNDAQIEGSIVPISARISGYINKVNFADNDTIVKGQVLLTLDDKDINIKVLQAQAALESALAQVAVAKANAQAAKTLTNTAQLGVATTEAGIDVNLSAVQVAQASVQTAQAQIDAVMVRVKKAQQDYNRYSKLFSQQSITQQQLDMAAAEKDAAEAQLIIAQKQLGVAQQQVQTTQKQQEVTQAQKNVSQGQTMGSKAQVTVALEQIAVAESAVKIRQTDLDFAKLQQSYCSLIAPQSGIISKKNAQVGQLIQAGTPIAAIVADTTIWVVANFKETQIVKIKQGQKAYIRIDAIKNQKIEGIVHSISPATGAKFALLPPDNASGNFVKVVQRIPVKIELKNIPKNLQPMLQIGLNVRAEIEIK